MTEFEGYTAHTASLRSKLLSSHLEKTSLERRGPVHALRPSHLFSWNADARDFWKPQTHQPSDISYPLQLALLLFLYFAIGRLGLAVPFTSANVSPVWPAAGVGMALVLIWGIRVAPAVAVAAFLVNFFTPIPKLAAVGIGLGNASSAVAAAYLLRHFLSFKT